LNDQIRVLVVDDSPFMRKALSREINSDSRFTVVGTACNGREGVELALQLHPAVITLDVEMPVQGGIETLKQLTAKSPAGVIMCSSLTEAGAQITLDALALGAVDFVPKARGTAFLHDKLLAAAAVCKKRGKPAAQPQPGRPSVAAPALPSQSWSGDFRPKALLIASSTGGPQALTEVLTRIHPPLPVPAFIAQHMPSPFTTALARRLATQSGHKVVEAQEGDPIVNGTFYIAPGGQNMRTVNGVIALSRDTGESRYQPSADILAASVLQSYGKNVVAVMMTGLGSDGTKEFTKLKQAGAWTIAQDAASCTVFGMPKALIEAGGASESLPLKSIASRIDEIFAKKH
jgi:two-component system chemotaxis response regulator CheB